MGGGVKARDWGSVESGIAANCSRAKSPTLTTSSCMCSPARLTRARASLRDGLALSECSMTNSPTTDDHDKFPDAETEERFGQLLGNSVNTPHKPKEGRGPKPAPKSE